MSLTKLSLAGTILIITGHGEFGYSDIPAGDGKIANLFLQCSFRNFQSCKIVFLLLFRCKGLRGRKAGRRAHQASDERLHGVVPDEAAPDRPGMEVTKIISAKI